MWTCYKLAVLLSLSLAIAEAATLHKLNEIYNNVSSQVNPQFSTVGETIIKNLMHYSQNQTKLLTQLHSMMDYITQINKLYDQMGSLMNGSNMEISSLVDFAKNVTSYETESILPPNAQIADSEILKLITEFLQKTQEGMVCSTNQSAQQILFNVYNTIKLTNVKRYIILKFAHIILQLHEKEIYTREAKFLMGRYDTRTLQSVEALKKVLGKNSRELWKCDPPKHIPGTTYIQVTQLTESEDNVKYSDCYFNMRSAIAKLEENKVVTGLRFTKCNHIIYLQIQEGELLPKGEIKESSVRWVPVEEYEITFGEDGVDFYTVTANERSIDLDELIADEGHLITGVRFKKIGSHLNFQIRISPFDFETGNLLDPIFSSIWKENRNTNNRTKLEISHLSTPTENSTVSKPDSKSNQYIDFASAAETIVPFLDAQPVASMFPVPLNGAGLYHKGREKSGGFIAPKILTYDLSYYYNLLPYE